MIDTVRGLQPGTWQRTLQPKQAVGTELQATAAALRQYMIEAADFSASMGNGDLTEDERTEIEFVLEQAVLEGRPVESDRVRQLIREQTLSDQELTDTAVYHLAKVLVSLRIGKWVVDDFKNNELKLYNQETKELARTVLALT